MNRFICIAISLMMLVSLTSCVIAEGFSFTPSDDYKIEWEGSGRHSQGQPSTSGDYGDNANTGENPANREDMEEIVAAIQRSVNERDISYLFDYLDPTYQREAFLLSEAIQNIDEVFGDFIPIFSESWYPDSYIYAPDVSLKFDEYIEENRGYGTLTYTVDDGNGYTYYESIAVVDISNKWYITNNGYSDWVAKNDYSLFENIDIEMEVDYQSLETFRRGKIEGLCTLDKKEIMAPTFDEIYGFVDGYCPVKIDDQWGLINEKGEYVVDCILQDIYNVPFDGYWWVKYGGQWGAVNFQTSKYVPCQYDEVLYAVVEKGLLSIKDDGKCGVVSGDGTVLIPFEYDDIGCASSGETENERIPVKQNGFWSVVDLYNNPIVPFIYTDMDNRYYDDMLVVGVNGAYGAIDRNGQFLVRVNPEYQYSQYHDVYQIDECMLRMAKTAYSNSSYAEGGIHLFDHEGNRILTEYHFNNTSNSKCYDLLSKDRCLVYSDEPWNNELTIGEDSTGNHANCFIIDCGGNVINLSSIIIDSISHDYPNEYRTAKESYESKYTVSNVDDGVLKIYCYLHAEHSKYLYNYMDYEGNFLLTSWVESDRAFMLTGERILAMSSKGEDSGEISIYDIVQSKYITNSVSIDMPYAYLLVHYGDITAIPESRIYIINNTYDDNIVVDMDNGIVYDSVGEFALLNYDVDIVDIHESVIVTDGVFYGLMTKDGLVGNGIMYTDWERNDYEGIYCLKYGAENEVYYRILPDGSALNMSEAEPRIEGNRIGVAVQSEASDNKTPSSVEELSVDSEEAQEDMGISVAAHEFESTPIPEPVIESMPELEQTSMSEPSVSYVKGVSGDSNMRTGPGLGYDSIGALKKGESAEYLNESSIDDRGAAWYRISFNGTTGWVSSKYTELTGGDVVQDDKFDLSGFGYRTVEINGSGSLVFQREPRGEFMSGYSYRDGDQIYVNLDWRQDGYAIAYENGVYGYVDAQYINWSGSNTQSSSAQSNNRDLDYAKDLSNYDYRMVDSQGRGSLVFQKEPRGKSIKGFKYYTGDWIYVNVDWRKEGYAMAYEDGTYGYVDASYIAW